MKVDNYQLNYQYKNTERVNILRVKAINSKASICIERARYFTESYKKTEGMNPHYRKAFALKRLLEKMTIYINEGELIIGNNSISPRASVVAPEYCSRWLSREINDPEKAPDIRKQDTHMVSTEVKNELLKDILPYWLGKTVEDRVIEKIPQKLINSTIPSLSDVGTIPIAPECYLRNGIGHVVVDYEMLLKKGFKGILDESKEKIKDLDLSNSGDILKHTFYKAAVIEYESIIKWILRYAELADKMSQENCNKNRKEELADISKNCKFISKNPPSNFWQALQTWFFAELILFGLEQNCTAVSPGRFDQYMYPFYKKDYEKGVITREKATELIQCLFIKLSEMSILWDYDSASYYSGFSMTLCMLVGGTDNNGNDATNELSYLILQADKNTGVLQPETGVRVHTNSPASLLMEAVKEVKIGRGKPKFFMDNAAIQMIRNTGVSLEESRNYSVVGCVELTPTGNTAAYTGAVFINMAKCLELALNNGLCFITGKTIGPSTGNPEEYKNYEDLIEAFKKQLSFTLKNTSIIMNAILQAHSELYPCPFTSTLIGNCMEKGTDFTGGGAVHNFIGVSGVGLPNVANSLSAIKRYVYEENKTSLPKLVDIMKKDFDGHEKLRLELWNKMPKFGNGDNHVDDIAREIGQFYCRELEKYKGPFGNKYRPGLFAVSINVPFGLATGATAEGRKALKPLADGGISPVAGTEIKGLLAVIKSATKIDNLLATNGTLLNIRLSPSIFDREEEIMKIVSLLKSYNELGGYHIQFNVIDNDVLRKAQESPENYKGLMVRVAGYSAYFIELNPEVQEDIISRTIHGNS
jgi:pyruvate formate-lyase/glycerol dehydratase family glycyl radical enzyme